MNVEIGTEAVQFPEEEYINGIFVCSAEDKNRSTTTSWRKDSQQYISALKRGMKYSTLSRPLKKFTGS